MKKLLLTALLAVSATAFAGLTTTVTSGTETLALPVTVKGNVVDATKLTMELTALDNAGADGRTMTFNFGNLVKGISVDELVGTFRVRLLKEEGSTVNEIPFDKEPKYTLVGGTVANDIDLTTSTGEAESSVTASNNVTLKYHLGSVKGLAKVTSNTEKLTVTADAKNATVGQFTDNSIKIKVTLDEANNSKK